MCIHINIISVHSPWALREIERDQFYFIYAKDRRANGVAHTCLIDSILLWHVYFYIRFLYDYFIIIVDFAVVLCTSLFCLFVYSYRHSEYTKQITTIAVDTSLNFRLFFLVTFAIDHALK